MKNGKWLILLGVITIALLGYYSSAQAQGEQPVSDDQVNAIAKELYCPVCENISLDVCSTTACAQWRELIREKIAAGWTEKQIKTYFAEQYGDRVLAVPPLMGLNSLIYILPPVIVFAGAIIVGYKIFSAKKIYKADELKEVAEPGTLKNTHKEEIENDLTTDDL
jgi:cytochrome c-type biogenesis protein CcmH